MNTIIEMALNNYIKYLEDSCKKIWGVGGEVIYPFCFSTIIHFHLKK